ncbi:hypothetical protein [Bacillus cereus]|uniref:hypothetical protein n=1 Tax=Bacillus cereus TaxID=1396 RepID=UPI001C3F25E9|nr:hypothetical protein [Bacillus cereus]
MREQYLGKTPGKKSRTGREVIEKMKNENAPRIRTTRAGKMQFKYVILVNQIWLI